MGNPSRTRLSVPQFVIPTGCIAIDSVLGIGGFPTGRWHVVTGLEGVGKTTVGLHLIAEAQKLGGIGIVYDMEHTFDWDYAEAIGVDPDRLILKPYDNEIGKSCPEEYLEAVLADMQMMLRDIMDIGAPVVILHDSINSTISKAEWKGGFEDQFYGPRATIYSSAIPKMLPLLVRSPALILQVSQIREKIEGVKSRTIKVSGGNAPRFHSSMVLELIRAGFVKRGEDPIGSSIIAKTLKNKLAAPFQEAPVDIYWGLGIDTTKSLMDGASQLGICQSKSGGWYEIITDQGEVFRRQGIWTKNGFVNLFKSRPDVRLFLERAVRQKKGWAVPPLPPGTPELAAQTKPAPVKRTKG